MTQQSRTVVTTSPDDRVGPARRVLVTGASGYIGGRLVPDLLGRGHAVRCLVSGR